MDGSNKMMPLTLNPRSKASSRGREPPRRRGTMRDITRTAGGECACMSPDGDVAEPKSARSAVDAGNLLTP